MKISPQKNREVVLLLLFSTDFSECETADLITFVSEELQVPKNIVTAARAKVDDLVKNLPEIDTTIATSSKSYDFQRIQRVERAILRLAVYELFFEKALSKKVVFAEAKRLAKKFSTPEASLFCEAVLEGILKHV